MPRKKKKKISIEEIKKRTPKIVFYTDKNENQFEINEQSRFLV